MSIKLELPKITDLKPRISVIGVGGAGGNAVNNMIAAGLTGVNFIVANTDAQALAASSAEHRIQLGVNLTEGLGAGSKPEIGEAAAEEAIDEIRAQISGSHMVFIAAGMGGGTGTGAASVIARVAKELDILTVAVVTKPFHFEGSRRMRIAEAGIAELRKIVDTLIVIPNQNLFRIANEKTTFAEAFVLADQVLYSGIACIVDLIVKEGLINLDFADVRTIMSGMGAAMMGTGEASGEHRAIRAAEEAISNPLLEDVSLRGAKGLLLSIIGGRDLTLYEVDEAASRVRQEVDPEANIIVGATFDDSLGDRVRVSIVASGMSDEPKPASSTPSPSYHTTVSRPSSAPTSQSQQPQHHPSSEAPTRTYETASENAPNQASTNPDHLVQTLSKAYDNSSGNNGDGSQSNTWRGPGDVLIEEGPPQLGPTISPPPLPTAGAQSNNAGMRPASEPFTPGPPVETRRGPRRMPTVEDFPPVGQREYRAKTGWYESQQRPRAYTPQHENESRGFNLFRRITGLARRTEQRAPDRQEFSAQPTRSVADRQPTQHSPAPQDGMPDNSSDNMHAKQQRIEIPVFFHKDRNRQQS
ncbi:MAG: cell division protein FtsZ [Proteobacteria bacterium]|jgi:cell division protein FtsZ|nr:MAG: cell division protein FtsZ [Pseudomonadota bacterium]